MATPPPSEQTSVVPSTKWWWVELWVENRALFKEMVKHVLFFGGLIGSLEGFHKLLGVSKLPDAQRELLNRVHFDMYLVALVIFAISFIIKVLYLEYKGIRK
jgi:hypothetical protein